MSSLREVYEDAWREQYGLPQSWVVNPEPSRQIKLGAIGRVDWEGFHQESTLADREIGLDLGVDPGEDPAGNPWDFKSNREIQVAVSVAGDAPAVGPLGEAAFDVNVSFGRKEGVTVHGSAKWFNGYTDLGVVRTVLVQAVHDGRLFKGDSVAVTQQHSGPGVMFVGEGHDANIQVQGSAKVSPGKLPPIASLSADLSFKSSSGAARYEVLEDGTVLASRLLYLGTRGFFWWRKVTAFGVADPLPELYHFEDREISGVQGDGENDYFALLEPDS